MVSRDFRLYSVVITLCLLEDLFTRAFVLDEVTGRVLFTSGHAVSVEAEGCYRLLPEVTVIG